MALIKAKMLHSVYTNRYAFSPWVLDENMWETYAWNETFVLYHKEDSLEEVKTLVTQREPCNIATHHHYDEDALERYFGWRHGAYKAGSPNVAILCTATVRTRTKGYIRVKVINLIGCAHDHQNQPDFKHYNTLNKIIGFYTRMWQLAFAAAKKSRCRKMRIYNVGGGVFASVSNFEKTVFNKAFVPDPDIEILGWSPEKGFDGELVPNILDKEDTDGILYVNAWDPWSIVGNGNAGDRSLDGAWGACSNMSVLCWPVTNPFIQYVSC